MVRQLTTSISDGLLVWSVLYFIYNIFWVNFFACIGLAVQGIAAGLGVVRFALGRQDGPFYEYHQMTSWLAHIMSVPLLAVGFCHKDLPIMLNFNLIFMMAVLVCSRFLAPGMRKLVTEACSGFGMLTIILICLRSWSLYGLMGAAAYIVSGAMIGSDGKMGMFLRVDLLHVGLVVGNVLFTWALLGLN